MQPRLTQVPPSCPASTRSTLAPNSAEARAARTPPEPPPITTRSKSNTMPLQYSNEAEAASRPSRRMNAKRTAPACSHRDVVAKSVHPVDVLQFGQPLGLELPYSLAREVHDL